MELSEHTLTMKMIGLMKTSEKQIGELAVGIGVGGGVMTLLVGSGNDVDSGVSAGVM